MKQKKWSPIQIQEALSLSKKVNYSISGISINSKKLKKNRPKYVCKTIPEARRLIWGVIVEAGLLF